MTSVFRTLGIVLALWQPASSVASHQPSDTGGALISVGEHRLFLSCSGPTGKGPTILLEAGGGGTSADWNLVREQLGTDVRVCAYDRAGLGRSERGPSPRTMRQEVFELHALLAAAKEPAPYVLVGQSIGGLLARLFAQSYLDEVAGVVLVDPTHESGMLGSLRYGGWVRLREKATGREVPAPRRAMAGGPPGDPAADYMAEELQQIFLARQTTPQPLGQRPLIVLAAGKRPAPPPGTSMDLWTTMRDERDGQVKELAGLSSNARFVRDDTSGHGIHRDNPSLVAQAIRDVRDAALSKKPLPPSPR